MGGWRCGCCSLLRSLAVLRAVRARPFPTREQPAHGSREGEFGVVRGVASRLAPAMAAAAPGQAPPYRLGRGLSRTGSGAASGQRCRVAAEIAGARRWAGTGCARPSGRGTLRGTSEERDANAQVLRG